LNINEIKRRGKAAGLAASLILCTAALTACGGSGEAVDLSGMTAQEQAQLEKELTETLEVDGVRLLTLYDMESDNGAEDDNGAGDGTAVENDDADAWDDAETENDDDAWGEISAENDGKSDAASGSGQDVRQRFFAVAVTVEQNGAAAGDKAARTVSYDIYDLANGLPGKSTKALQKISIQGYTGSDSVPCDIRDLNFDGAKDISLRLADDEENAAGAFFLWDEGEGRFAEQKELGQLSSPIIKEEYRIVQEHIYISEKEYTDNLYRWEGNQLVPTRRILQRAPNANSLQGEVYDWYDDYWEPMYERKILVSPGEWTAADYEKAEDLTAELADYYDPDYIGW